MDSETVGMISDEHRGDTAKSAGVHSVGPDSSTTLDQTNIMSESPVTPTMTASRKKLWLSVFKRKDVRIGLAVLALVAIVASMVGWRIVASNRRTAGVAPVARFAAAVEPFRVVSTSPSDGQTGVDAATPITITFNKPVDAQTLKGDFFPSPQVDGTFTQGNSDKQIIFIPSTPFAQSTIVKTMIHGEFADQGGQSLGKDFYFGFTTAIPGDQVTFSTGDTYPRLSALANGKSLDFSIEAGQDIGSGGTVITYKATLPALLRALTYKETSEGAAVNREFVFSSVPTGGLQSVATSQGFDKPIHFAQGPGVYVLVASQSGQQVGSTWVVVNDHGVIVRQDDQRLVAMAENFADQASAKGTVDFYQLKQSVRLLRTEAIEGMQSYDLAGQDVDVLVAHLDGDEVVVPLNVPYSLADMRLPEDSGQTKQGTIITDRPTYAAGETVKFAGFVRQDHDAQYQLAEAGAMTLQIKPVEGLTPLATIAASVDNHGVISGQFVAQADFLDTANGQKAAALGIFDSGGKQFGAFSVVDKPSSPTEIAVRFNKHEYVASESVAATVTVTSNGQPMSGPVTATMYARAYSEDGDNPPSPSLGEQVGDKDQTVQLNSAGQATITVDPATLPGGSSQLVTVQVTGGANKEATGRADAIIHQGNGYLTFGVFRRVYGVGEPVTARVGAHALDGSVLPAANIHYRFATSGYDTTAQKSTSTTLAEGQVTADESGLAEIHQALNVSDGASVMLTAWMSDGQHNKIEATNYISVYTDVQARVYSQAELLHFDVMGTTGVAAMGDTLHLHIASPFTVLALATVERGRIYHQEVISLKQGDNTYDLMIEPGFAPSFSLSFSYFRDGRNVTEGFVVDVPARSSQAQVTAVMSKSAYQNSETPMLTVGMKDADGKPLSGRVVVRVADATIFSQQSVLDGDIFDDWYGARERTVNEASSLSGIGSGGSGACGAGGDDLSYTADRTGATLYFNGTQQTNDQGQLQVSLPSQAGQWRVEVFAANDQSQVGQMITSYEVH